MSDDTRRREMHLRVSRQPISETWPMRPITLRDASILGNLMYDAYHNTIDDEGESPEEARQEIHDTLTGKYGPLLSDCSFLIEKHGQALSASIVTSWTDKRDSITRPLLAFLMVHPTEQGKGMATLLLKKSINALQARGDDDFVLFVTAGNENAQHIYHKLGFKAVEESK